MAAKEGTTVVQEEEDHHYVSVKAAIRQATNEPFITHRRLRRKRRKSEPQVGKHAVVKEGPSLHQQTEERTSTGPEILAPQYRQSARYCLLEMRYGGGDS